MRQSQKSISLTVATYAFLGCAWILGSDYLLDRFFPVPLGSLGWQTVKGMAFVLATAIFFYLALSSTAAKVAIESILTETVVSEEVAGGRTLPPKRLRIWVPVAIFLLLTLLLSLAGVAVYRQISGTMRFHAWDDLITVAGLKARQVEIWRQERLADAKTITGDVSFMTDLQGWLLQGDPEDPPTERLARRLQAIRQAYGYQSVMLYDLQGNRRFFAAKEPGIAPVSEPSGLLQALQKSSPVFSVFYTPPPGPQPFVDAVVPLANGGSGQGAVFGALVLRMSVDNLLFPALQRWPGIHGSGETLLVQQAERQKPTVFFFRKGSTPDSASTGLDYRKDLEAFLAESSREGVFEIRDGQGRPILVAVEEIPDSDWRLVSVIGRGELYRPLVQLGLVSAVAVLFLVGVAGVGTGLWWRQQMAGFALEGLQGQLQRHALRKHYEYLTRFANDIILLLDDQGLIVEANDRAVSTYAYSRKELLGRNIRELRAPDNLGDFDQHWDGAFSKGIIFETRHRRADGSLFPVEVSARRIEVGGRNWCQSIIRDITERRQSEQKIQRLTRLYNVLSQTNQAIVRHGDRQNLFEAICKIAVELGFLRMAVITAIDLVAGKIEPVAAFGADPAFLGTINYQTLGGEGGPTLQVARGKRPYISNDVTGDPLLQNRLDAADRFGFRSLALFPLLRGDDLFGTLNLYAAETDFFSPDMVAVLQEMADDIGFALSNFEKEVARNKAEKRLRETTATLKAIYQATPLPLMIIDLEGCATFWNPAAEETFGWPEEEVVGQPLPLVPLDQKEEFFREIAQAKRGEPLRGVEVRRQCRDGSQLDMLLFTAPLYNGTGEVRSFVALLMDITEQKKARDHIVCLAHYDQLTGLANRTLLRERFVMETSRARREGRSLALCLIDLDKFKSVNDALGHSLGDKLLVQVARCLENNLRRADVICRPGGDEFLLLLTGLDDPQNSGLIARKILQNLEEPFVLEGHTVRISASMGISLFPQDGVDLDTLFQSADTAMYAAKGKGRNTFVFFRSEMNQRIRDRLNIENSLRTGLEERLFSLQYQPQVDVASGRVVGAEALLRYSHPERGPIPPFQFIPVAEDSGLIVPIGEWILEEACRQLRLWQEKGLTDLTMAINISPVQVFQENFLTRALAILDAQGIQPGRLKFELTESIFLEEDDRVRQTLLALKKLGVGISLDDFGTGYSSLSYLKRYAVDEIKIDRAFIRDVCNNSGDAAIVRATIQMAHSLGLTAVAEGVEETAQLDFLQDQQCDNYQGYLCSRPLHPDQFFSLVDPA